MATTITKLFESQIIVLISHLLFEGSTSSTLTLKNELGWEGREDEAVGKWD